MSYSSLSLGSLEDLVHCQMPDKTCSYNSKVSKHDLDSSSVSCLQDVSSPDEHPQELSVVGDQPVQYKSKRKDHSDGVDDKDASSNKNNLQEFEVVSEALRCNSSQAAQFESTCSSSSHEVGNVI